MNARLILLLALLPGARAAAQASLDSARTAPVPVAVRTALASSPLVDGDGAVVVALGRDSALVAAGTGIADSVGVRSACTVARLRAARELVRYVDGAHVESRIAMGTSERTGDSVRQHFDEQITERVAGTLGGAALVDQWWLEAPHRCRVGLWIRLAPTPAGGASR